MGSASGQPVGFLSGQKDGALVVHPKPWDLWFGQYPAKPDSKGEGGADGRKLPADCTRFLALVDSLIRILLEDRGRDLVNPCSMSKAVTHHAERAGLPGGLGLAVCLLQISEGLGSLGPSVNILAFSDLGPDLFEDSLGSSPGAYLPADIPARWITPSSEPGIPNRDPVKRPTNASFVHTLNPSGNLNPDLTATRTDDLAPAEKTQGALLAGNRSGNA